MKKSCNKNNNISINKSINLNVTIYIDKNINFIRDINLDINITSFGLFPWSVDDNGRGIPSQFWNMMQCIQDWINFSMSSLISGHRYMRYITSSVSLYALWPRSLQCASTAIRSFKSFAPLGTHIRWLYLWISASSVSVSTGLWCRAWRSSISLIETAAMPYAVGAVSLHKAATMLVFSMVVRYPFDHLVRMPANMLFDPPVCFMKNSNLDKCIATRSF